MQIIQDTTEFQLSGKSAVAIGKFDGLHRGHIALLSRVLEQKERGLSAVAFTFHPSASVFFGNKEEKELTTREEKRKLFENMGIDVLIEYPLKPDTAAVTPEDFVKNILSERMHTAFIAAGTDLSFGYRGAGNQELLKQMAGNLGYETQIIDKVFCGEREISSSYVREVVEQGDMKSACDLLGRYYSFEGTVESGRKLGRRLGMPTMNQYPRPEKLLPPRGVYYSQVLYKGGTYPGITNIGMKPTVNDTPAVSVETYLYDFDRDMYGKEIVTELLQFKRSEQRFESISKLKEQMEKDIAQGRLFHTKED